MAVYFDYETFSECSLVKAGTWAYARHPSTRILCLSWAVDWSEPRIWWPGGTVPDELMCAMRGQIGACRAFNALFEYSITKYVGSRVGLPTIPLERWEDTQAISRMCAFPGSLQGTATALKLDINKDKDGGRLIQFFSMPQRDGSINLPKDHPEEFKRLCNYCKQDVRVDREVHAKLPVQGLPDFEKKAWIEDAIINERGVLIDVGMAKAGVALREIAREQACKQLPKLTGDKVFSLGQSKRILAFAAGIGFPLANLQKDIVNTALDVEDMPTALRVLLELRASSNLTSVAKYAAMLGALCDDNRIRGIHAYHTATTGRWGGRIVQFQNLPRSKIKLNAFDHQLIREMRVEDIAFLYGVLMPVLRDALRNTVIAKPGHTLHVVDKASIEARVLGWLADEKGYQHAFTTGLDLYKVCAAFIFNKKYEDVTDDERWVGKQSILGQGYGQGPDGFQAFCDKNGRKIQLVLCQQAVNGYRTKFPRIPLYWKTVEIACKQVIRTRQPIKLPHGITISMSGSHLTIFLPSGRALWYPHATLAWGMTKWGKKVEVIKFMTEVNKRWVPAATYGGRLVENMVQAIARDLLAEALFKCEEQKLNPVMHVHDEIVCETESSRPGVLDAMHKIFRTVPPWGTGLILGSGGFSSPFYKKG